MRRIWTGGIDDQNRRRYIILVEIRQNKMDR